MNFFTRLKEIFGPSGIKTRVEPAHPSFSWRDDAIGLSVVLTCTAKEPRNISSLEYALTMEKVKQDSDGSAETVTIIEGSHPYEVTLEPGQSVTESFQIPLAPDLSHAGLDSSIASFARVAQNLMHRRNQEYLLSVAPTVAERKGLSYRSARIHSQHL